MFVLDAPDRVRSACNGYKCVVRNWMNLRQAAYLVAVIEERSFPRAAARLHIAQPALSQQIKALEDLVGVELVERSARGIAPTPAGRAF
nr:LysR family transcriptional regulator [Micromonospora sp. DSM 115978]